MDDINAKQRRANELLASSIALDKQVESDFKACCDIELCLHSITNAKKHNEAQMEANKLRMQAQKTKVKSQKQNKTRNRILLITLPKLNNTLAAFRTETMEFVGADKGVVLQ